MLSKAFTSYVDPSKPCSLGGVAKFAKAHKIPQSLAKQQLTNNRRRRGGYFWCMKIVFVLSPLVCRIFFPWGKSFARIIFSSHFFFCNLSTIMSKRITYYSLPLGSFLPCVWLIINHRWLTLIRTWYLNCIPPFCRSQKQYFPGTLKHGIIIRRKNACHSGIWCTNLVILSVVFISETIK